MAAAQRSCPSTHSLEGSSLHLHAVPYATGHILCDVSRGLIRPIVPEQYRRDVFCSIHTIAHPGTRATRRLISARFCWKGMAADITAWCRECQGCNRGKVTTQPAAPAQPIPIPCRRFTHVHVDLVGPLPISSGGFNHIFTMIDRSTRWLEAVPLKDTSATTCADTFVATWVARFDVPECITSDRGPQFTSAVWSALCSRLGISRSLTTAFHPQSNSLVERAHCQLKDALRARAAGHDWPSHLPWVLLGLQTAPKEDSNISSAELCLGAPLTLPGEFIAAAAGVCGLLAGGTASAFNKTALLCPGGGYPSFQSPESKICVYSRRWHGAVPPALICGPVPGSQRRRQVFHCGDRG
jgi:hypothetical protein